MKTFLEEIQFSKNRVLLVEGEYTTKKYEQFRGWLVGDKLKGQDESINILDEDSIIIHEVYEYNGEDNKKIAITPEEKSIIVDKLINILTN